MNILLLSTVAVGVLHALAPDHWLPFTMMARTERWSRRKITSVTFLAGLGHVSSSLLIADIGIFFGVASETVNLWESERGNIASLLLIGFGVASVIWGIKNWGRKHTHEVKIVGSLSSWALFALIVFGPCEPLIPLIFAGSAYGWAEVFLIFSVFGLSTILTMLVQVHVAVFGISLFRSHWFKHASDVVAGGVIAVTGIVIRMLGI